MTVLLVTAILPVFSLLLILFFASFILCKLQVSVPGLAQEVLIWLESIHGRSVYGDLPGQATELCADFLKT